jgi:hypothetical protein
VQTLSMVIGITNRRGNRARARVSSRNANRIIVGYLGGCYPAVSHPLHAARGDGNFFSASVEVRTLTIYRTETADLLTHFAVPRDIRGKATPATLFIRADPTRHSESLYNPDANLIYLVRDPIDRLRSHFVPVTADGDRPRRLLARSPVLTNCLYEMQSIANVSRSALRSSSVHANRHANTTASL